MSYAAGVNAYSLLLGVCSLMRFLQVSHVGFLNRISGQLGLGWRIWTGYDSRYAALTIYYWRWSARSNRALVNLYDELNALTDYDWTIWQDDHFAVFDFRYEAAVYDWDQWLSDLFDPDTVWE